MVAHGPMTATAGLVIPSLLMLDFVLGGQIIVSDKVDCWSRGLRSHEEPVGISWNQQGLAVTERSSLEKDEVTKAKGGEKDNRWCAWIPECVQFLWLYCVQSQEKQMKKMQCVILRDIDIWSHPPKHPCFSPFPLVFLVESPG